MSDSWKGIKWFREPLFDDDGVQRTSGIGSVKGGPAEEYPDPTPMAVPVGFQRHDPLAQMLKDLVRSEVLAMNAGEEVDTFEEDQDYEVEDDMFPVDPRTPYEAVFDPPVPTPPAAAVPSAEDATAKSAPEAAEKVVAEKTTE